MKPRKGKRKEEKKKEGIKREDRKRKEGKRKLYREEGMENIKHGRQSKK